MITVVLFQFILLYFIIFVQKKLSFLIDNNKNTVHKIAFKSSLPLSGALYFFISILIFSFYFIKINFFIISTFFFFNLFYYF